MACLSWRKWCQSASEFRFLISNKCLLFLKFSKRNGRVKAKRNIENLLLVYEQSEPSPSERDKPTLEPVFFVSIAERKQH